MIRQYRGFAKFVKLHWRPGIVINSLLYFTQDWFTGLSRMVQSKAIQMLQLICDNLDLIECHSAYCYLPQAIYVSRTNYYVKQNYLPKQDSLDAIACLHAYQVQHERPFQHLVKVMHGTVPSFPPVDSPWKRKIPYVHWWTHNINPTLMSLNSTQTNNNTGVFCPFAHGANLIRYLKGLTNIIPISIVKSYPKGDDKGWPGWKFHSTEDPYEGATDHHLSRPNFCTEVRE